MNGISRNMRCGVRQEIVVPAGNRLLRQRQRHAGSVANAAAAPRNNCRENWSSTMISASRPCGVPRQRQALAARQPLRGFRRTLGDRRVEFGLAAEPVGLAVLLRTRS